MGVESGHFSGPGEVVTRKEELDMIVWKAVCLKALFRYSIAMVVIVDNRIAVLYLSSKRQTCENGQIEKDSKYDGIILLLSVLWLLAGRCNEDLITAYCIVALALWPRSEIHRRCSTSAMPRSA